MTDVVCIVAGVISAVMSRWMDKFSKQEIFLKENWKKYFEEGFDFNCSAF